MTDEIDPWALLDQEPGPDLPLFQVRFDHLRNPRNGREKRGLILESGDWVNCVARTAAGDLVMIRQYRIGVRDFTLETPGGMVDPGEEHGVSARRELLEETGYGGGSWHYLGAVQPNPAIHNHLCHHWLADGVELQGDQQLGSGEDIQIVLMSAEAVGAEVRAGRLQHALALSALSRVYSFWATELVSGALERPI